VLHRFNLLLKRFQRDERGAFLVLFGVLAIVLIATSGAVVDFTQIEQARTRAQNALDAAALGLQPHVFDTSPTWTVDRFKTEGTNLLVERLGDSRITASVTDATINVREGQLILNARITVPTSFVALVGVANVSARLVSEATRKRLNLEVAMVLDNSGSMSGYSRMVELKKAAKKATDILFDYQPTQPNVFISIIPFTQYVNVGTSNRTASWMSQTGASSVSHRNFDDDERDSTAFTGTVNRWSLFDGFSNEPWKGCVEARITPFDADDTIPNNAVPDTMFQPMFPPDVGPNNDLYWDGNINYIEPDTSSSCRVAPVWKQTRTKNNCTSNGNGSATNFNACSGGTNTYTGTTNEWGADVASPPTSQPANNSVFSYYNTGACTTVYTSQQTNWSPARWRNIRTITCTYNFSDKELEERICKYAGKSFWGSGPANDCVSTPILPLTNVRDTVKGRIDAMLTEGSTNIEQGAIWGFHSLSPTEPLTEGRSYDEATSKILIIMTDGENNVKYEDYTAGNPFGTYGWSAWGYRRDKRLLTESTTPKDSSANWTQVTTEVNRRTVLACTNAKAKGILVYTIGLAAPNSMTIQMLKDCASPSKVEDGQTINYWYFPNNSDELTDVFEKIASQLSELRLAQ
jgi:hypothetical protein